MIGRRMVEKRRVPTGRIRHRRPPDQVKRRVPKMRLLPHHQNAQPPKFQSPYPVTGRVLIQRLPFRTPSGIVVEPRASLPPVPQPPNMRPILLAGHERALTQIRYPHSPDGESQGPSPLTGARSLPRGADTTSTATSSSPSQKTSTSAPGSPTMASASAPTKATSVPSGPSTSTPPPP